MSRIAVIVAAVVALGAVVLALAPARRSMDEGQAVAAVEMADAASGMRLCVGPARVTFGGEPFVGLAFGGDGCDHSAADVVGFRILRRPTVRLGPMIDVLFGV
jgi:hypothetical protein